MAKILSQAGNSLADVYDVEGSIAGIDNLETRDLPIVHEMGSTVFSERFSQIVLRRASGATAQSTAWDVVVNNLVTSPFRIQAVSVFITTTARVAFASVAVRHADSDREVPIWAWDDAEDPEIRVRHQPDGGVPGTAQFLRPVVPMTGIPNLMAGSQAVDPMADIAFRGQTTAFGAGTVEAIMLLQIGLAEIGGISSRGLPIPSW